MIKPNDELECKIGISISKKCWNKGYGKEAIYSLIQYLQNTGFKLIKAWSQRDNANSIEGIKPQGRTLNPNYTPLNPLSRGENKEYPEAEPRGILRIKLVEKMNFIRKIQTKDLERHYYELSLK